MPVSESSGAVQVEIETLIKLEFLWLKANITPDHWLKDFAEAPFKERCALSYSRKMPCDHLERMDKKHHETNARRY
jgi:hypothetical protein